MAFNHMVTRKYLDGFETEPESGLVHRFDKTNGTWSAEALPIARVGGQNNYYSDNDEKTLAEVFEAAANPYIDEIRRTGKITPDARTALPAYLACQVTRVEEPRKMARKIYPSALKNLEERWTARLTTDGMEDLLPKLREVIARWGSDMPEDVAETVYSPVPRPRIIAALTDPALMWRTIENPRKDFVTSDNPVVRTWGLDHPETEIWWPVSPSIGVYMTRTGNIFMNVRRHHLTLLNRRVTSTADRYIFARKREPWIQKNYTRPWCGAAPVVLSDTGAAEAVAQAAAERQKRRNPS